MRVLLRVVGSFIRRLHLGRRTLSNAPIDEHEESVEHRTVPPQPLHMRRTGMPAPPHPPLAHNPPAMLGDMPHCICKYRIRSHWPAAHIGAAGPAARRGTFHADAALDPSVYVVPKKFVLNALPSADIGGWHCTGGMIWMVGGAERGDSRNRKEVSNLG